MVQELIANFQTGLDLGMEPWLTPDEAFIILNDYRTEKGVLLCRPGISGFAQGGRNSKENEQSRIYEIITDEDSSDSSTNLVYRLANAPIRPGSITVRTVTPSQSATDTATDQFTGTFSGDVSGGGNNTINYQTGEIDLTWNSNPSTNALITYTAANGNPVMMIATFIEADRDKQCVVASTDQFNTYDVTNNRFVTVTANEEAVTGEAVGDTNQNFSHNTASIKVKAGSVTITDSTGTPQVLTDDGAGNLTGDGTGTINYNTGAITGSWTSVPTAPITIDYTVVSNFAQPTGNDTQFFSWTMYPDKNRNPRLLMVNNNDADGVFQYDGTSFSLWNNSNAADNPDYEDSSVGALKSALHITYMGERLLAIRPILGASNKVYSRRIMYTGINNAQGNGDKFNAPTASFIDLSTQYWIQAVKELKDSLIVYAGRDVFEISVSNNSNIPFTVRQLNFSDFIEVEAAYSAITWMGECFAIGRQGMVGTDGRSVYRPDLKIPFFTRDRFGELGGTATTEDPNRYVTGNVVPALDQFWITYPDVLDGISGNGNTRSTRILCRNFVEDSWAINRLQVQVTGQFERQFSVIWDDVDGDLKDEWAQWDTTDTIWDELGLGSLDKVTLVGNEDGFINDLTGIFDESASISNITQANPAVVSCEPDKFKVGDTVIIRGVSGMEINGTSAINNIESIVTAIGSNATKDEVTISADLTDASAYTSGGVIQKILKRECVTKPLNPFVKQGKKCRLKKIGFYIDTDKQPIKVDLYSDRRTDPYKTEIVMQTTGTFGDAEKKWAYITVNQTANFHRFRLYSENGPANERVHAFMFDCEPVGRLNR